MNNNKKISRDNSQTKKTSNWLNNGISAFNGIIGDYLNQRENELAIDMAFYNNNKAIDLNKSISEQINIKLSSKICIFVHGLCCNESFWFFNTDSENKDQYTSYGILLNKEKKYTPFYLRYNSGLHISENGEKLSNLLDQFISAYDKKINEISLIGHSMGGLLLSSASIYGQNFNHKWIKKAKNFIYIGSPHMGSPLEKLGNIISFALDIPNHPVTDLIEKIVNVRSSGIKDLRYGNIKHEEWKDHNPDEFLTSHREKISLLQGAKHYAIAGTIPNNPDGVASNIIGDALVRKPSALIDDMQKEYGNQLKSDNIQTFPGVNHINLGHNLDVYKQIKKWLDC